MNEIVKTIDLDAKAFKIALEAFDWPRLTQTGDLHIVLGGSILAYLAALPQPQATTVGVTEPPEMALLRGPLSKRATSAEFNEWQAREIVAYVDRLRYALIGIPGAEKGEAERTVGGQIVGDNPLHCETMGASDYCYHCSRDVVDLSPCPVLEELRLSTKTQIKP